MRTLRMAVMAFAIAGLVVSSAMGAAAQQTSGPVVPVSGSVVTDLVPGGDWDVQDRVFRYRDYPISGTVDVVSDPRFEGTMTGSWSWDVPASGKHPIPAWGQLMIKGDEGSWTGTMTGIQRGVFDPVEIRAFLVGEGAYEGMCATLDIDAPGMTGGDTWHLDGVVHPLPMPS